MFYVSHPSLLPYVLFSDFKGKYSLVCRQQYVFLKVMWQVPKYLLHYVDQQKEIRLVKMSVQSLHLKGFSARYRCHKPSLWENSHGYSHSREVFGTIFSFFLIAMLQKAEVPWKSLQRWTTNINISHAIQSWGEEWWLQMTTTMIKITH